MTIQSGYTRYGVDAVGNRVALFCNECRDETGTKMTLLNLIDVTTLPHLFTVAASHELKVHPSSTPPLLKRRPGRPRKTEA